MANNYKEIDKKVFMDFLKELQDKQVHELKELTLKLYEKETKATRHSYCYIKGIVVLLNILIKEINNGSFDSEL